MQIRVNLKHPFLFCRKVFLVEFMVKAREKEK